MAMVESDELAKKRIEAAWLKNKRDETYTALDDGIINFQWSKSEVNEFIKMWNDGASIMRLSGHFHRPQKDLGILIMDLSLKRRIEPREKGLWG
ncbi:hypothetical protein ACFP7A_01335 [Sporolactobacillus kofuensis]|uniref:Uncharacterized protein n=1 Tax=Sporolactobacillus kofuensis TaxID=269672 RepID=A0ABW1WCL3_9BACL|nr:hypothetical protein [Sporolactobacillus kofuensis]MCO7177040.1 hypothetical protein [Sporolactobacillus kofuensis]